jgi:mannitol-specific phosphotransferase system IIBC component
MPKSPNSIVITDDNRERLERHCKTTFPNDVIAVVPSVLTSCIGVKELEEQDKKRQKLRQQAEDRAKRKAEKQREEEKKKKSSKKS